MGNSFENAEIKKQIEEAVWHLTKIGEYPQAAKNFIGFRIQKDKIVSFLEARARSKKEDLIEEVLKSESKLAEFLEKFKSDLSLTPTDIEYILKCTKTERLRWTESGKLRVLEQHSFQKYKKVFEYPVFDVREIAKIKQEDIEAWRRERKTEVAMNRVLGIKQAKETKAKHSAIRADFADTWQGIHDSWATSSPECFATLMLGYWTVWISRWAKEYHLKASRAIKHSTTYSQRSDELYDLKNEAVELLSHSPFSQLSFYRPPSPDKLIWGKVDYYDDDDDDDDDRYYDNNDYYGGGYRRSRRKVINRIKDYYSLYYLRIQPTEFPQYEFSFHTPHPIGKDFYAEPSALPKVNHQEQEGMFRFGRMLDEDEKIIHREKLVAAEFEKALSTFKSVFEVESKVKSVAATDNTKVEETPDEVWGRWLKEETHDEVWERWLKEEEEESKKQKVNRREKVRKPAEKAKPNKGCPLCRQEISRDDKTRLEHWLEFHPVQMALTVGQAAWVLNMWRGELLEKLQCDFRGNLNSATPGDGTTRFWNISTIQKYLESDRNVVEESTDQTSS